MAMITIPVCFRSPEQLRTVRLLLADVWDWYEDADFFSLSKMLRGEGLERKLPPYFIAAMRCSGVVVAAHHLPRDHELPFKFAGRTWYGYLVTIADRNPEEHVEEIKARLRKLKLSMIGPTVAHGMCLIATKSGFDQEALVRRLGCELEPATMRELLLD